MATETQETVKQEVSTQSEQNEAVILRVNEELQAEYAAKSMNDAADAIRKVYRKVLGIKDDPFQSVDVKQKDGSIAKELQFQSFSKFIGAAAEKKFPTVDANGIPLAGENLKNAKSDQLKLKKQLINRSKFYKLADFVEACLDAMGYRRVLKSASKNGDVGFAMQKDSVFNNKAHWDFATEERARVARNAKRRADRLVVKGDAELQAALKLINDKLESTREIEGIVELMED